MDQARAFGRPLLVTGPESLLAERAVSDYIERALAERPDAAVNRLEASDLDAGALAEATGGSLFASASIVVINDLASLPEQLNDQLVAQAGDPGPDLALVIVHGGGVKGKGLLDRLKKLRPEIVDCQSLKPWNLPQFVNAEVRRAKGRADAAACEAMVDAVGADLRALAAAVRQLLDDSAERTITEAAVRRYFGGRAEVTGFAVADDTMAGNGEGALGKLRWALATGVAPVQVTSALSSSLRGLGKYLDGRDLRLSDPDLAKLAGVPPWKLKDLSRLSRDWKPGAVAQAIQAVAIADAQIKGAASDPGFALEQAVLKVISYRGRR